MRHLFKLICGVLLSGIYFVPAQTAELNNDILVVQLILL